MTAMLTHFAHAQGSAVNSVTYIEVMAGAAKQAAALLESYRDTSRKQDGNLRFDALQEIRRPNRFVIVERWRDQAARDADAAHTAQFQQNLKAIETAPEDVRLNNLLFSGNGKATTGPNTIYVVTHADVLPEGKDSTIAALKTMSDETVKQPGNIDYEAYQQANRGNHFTIIEEWQNESTLDAHEMTPPTRAFRDELNPFRGAPYDERLYKALN